MNSLIRWGMTIGLAMGIMLISGLGFNSPSLALPEPQVIQKLESIPMFMIVNQDGDLVLISPRMNEESAKSEPRLVIFGDYNDAFKMLENLQKNNATLAGKIKIVPIAFSKVYEMLKPPKQEQDKLPPITLYSKQEEIVAATTIRQERGEKTEDLQQLGIPLFFVTIGKNQEFIVKEDEAGNSFIPFYMDSKEAQADIEQYTQRFPESKPDEIKIQVIPLLELITVLLEQNEEVMKMMEVIPSEQQVNEANRLLENPKQPVP